MSKKENLPPAKEAPAAPVPGQGGTYADKSMPQAPANRQMGRKGR
ncbi:hypothetical protein [Solidesulfovibrio sp.]